VLEALLAALSAVSFALNNAMTRRGVLSGSGGQARWDRRANRAANVLPVRWRAESSARSRAFA
jgi:hypothetical protein